MYKYIWECYFMNLDWNNMFRSRWARVFCSAGEHKCFGKWYNIRVHNWRMLQCLFQCAASGQQQGRICQGFHPLFQPEEVQFFSKLLDGRSFDSWRRNLSFPFVAMSSGELKVTKLSLLILGDQEHALLESSFFVSLSAKRGICLSFFCFPCSMHCRLPRLFRVTFSASFLWMTACTSPDWKDGQLLVFSL